MPEQNLTLIKLQRLDSRRAFRFGPYPQHT